MRSFDISSGTIVPAIVNQLFSTVLTWCSGQTGAGIPESKEQAWMAHYEPPSSVRRSIGPMDFPSITQTSCYILPTPISTTLISVITTETTGARWWQVTWYEKEKKQENWPGAQGVTMDFCMVQMASVFFCGEAAGPNLLTLLQNSCVQVQHLSTAPWQISEAISLQYIA